MTVQKNSFNRIPHRHRSAKDSFPPPLLLSVPRDNGLVARKTGSNHHQFSDFVPFSSRSFIVEYHSLVSDPGPRNDQRPAGNLFANKDTSVELAIHSFSLSLIHHMMSLNIDMKIIRPWNCFGFAHFVHELLDFMDELQ